MTCSCTWRCKPVPNHGSPNACLRLATHRSAGELRSRAIHQHVVLLVDGGLNNRLDGDDLTFTFHVSAVRTTSRTSHRSMDTGVDNTLVRGLQSNVLDSRVSAL
jgi:hypothetical protein